MSYLDNEFNLEDSHREDEDDNLDEKAPMSKEDILELIIDEQHKIINDMFDNLNDYINSKDYIFPIIQKLNITNFDSWFSKFIRPVDVKTIQMDTKKDIKSKNNKRHKNNEF
jgi:hypothetical protein